MDRSNKERGQTVGRLSLTYGIPKDMDRIVDFILSFYGPTPYFIVFGILLLCGLGLPIPEDITLFAGGLLSYYGVTDVQLMIAVSFVGVLLGDSIIFFLGSRYGRKLTQKRPFSRFLNAERLEQVEKEFQKRGNRVVFFARFMPGLRAPIFFSAGMLKLPYRLFLLFNGGAALLSVPLFVYLPYRYGDRLEEVVRSIQSFERILILVISIVAARAFFVWRKRKRESISTQADSNG